MQKEQYSKSAESTETKEKRLSLKKPYLEKEKVRYLMFPENNISSI